RRRRRPLFNAFAMPPGLDGKPAPEPPPAEQDVPQGIIVGHAVAHFRKPNATAEDPDPDIRTLEPGDDVIITTLSGVRLEPVVYRYALAGYFRSEMSEYDSNYVFVPLEHLQKLRAMDNRATSIQIRLRDYNDAKPVVERLKALFANEPLEVKTWE